MSTKRSKPQPKNRIQSPVVQGALDALSDKFAQLCTGLEDPTLWPLFGWSSGTSNDRPETPESKFWANFDFLVSRLALEFRREHQRRFEVNENEGVTELPTDIPIFEELVIIGCKREADGIGSAKVWAILLLQNHRRPIQNLIRVAADLAGKRLSPELLNSLSDRFISQLESQIKEEAKLAYRESARWKPAAKGTMIEGGRVKAGREADADGDRRQSLIKKAQTGTPIRIDEAAFYWNKTPETIRNWLNNKLKTRRHKLVWGSGRSDITAESFLLECGLESQGQKDEKPDRKKV